MTACKSPVIVLKDVRNHDIEALLDYIYLGEVNINHKDLSSVLKTAESLKIKGLAFIDKDSSKIHVNSTSSHEDTLQDSPPPKRQRQDSNSMTPHAVSAVTSPQDKHPVIKFEKDFAEGQEQTFRRVIDYKEGASSVHNPGEGYGLEITKTEHEVEIDDFREQEETFSRKNTYEGDASGVDLSKIRHDSENDDNASLPESLLTNISQGVGATHQKQVILMMQQQQKYKQLMQQKHPRHPHQQQLQHSQQELLPSPPEQPLQQQHPLFPKNQVHQGGEQPIAGNIN
ncbi:unnamed protein product, partial [Meganyctiphanes norvegica]